MKSMLVTLSIDLPGLGEKIKQIRESKKLTPTQVAARAGMSTANLYRIESETTKSIPRDTLIALGKALGVDFDSKVKEVLKKEVI